MDEPLKDRVAKLERANRRLSRALALSVMLLGVLTLATRSWSDGPAEILRARGLVIEDAAGVGRMVFEVTSSDAAALTVLDERRRKRLSLVAAPEGTTSLSFHRPGTIPMLTLRQDPDGRSAILMGQKEGGMLLTTDLKGSGGLLMIGPEGRLLARFPDLGAEAATATAPGAGAQAAAVRR